MMSRVRRGAHCDGSAVAVVEARQASGAAEAGAWSRTGEALWLFDPLDTIRLQASSRCVKGQRIEATRYSEAMRFRTSR
jgi:hypothetical protein